MGVKKKKIINKPAWNICHKAQRALGTGAQQSEATSATARKWCNPNGWFRQHHLSAATQRHPAELVWTLGGTLSPPQGFSQPFGRLVHYPKTQSRVHLSHPHHCACVKVICFSQSVVATARAAPPPPSHCTFCLWRCNLFGAPHKMSPTLKKQQQQQRNQRKIPSHLILELNQHLSGEKRCRASQMKRERERGEKPRRCGAGGKRRCLQHEVIRADCLGKTTDRKKIKPQTPHGFSFH